MFIKLLAILANVMLVIGDCDNNICVGDFLRDFFKNEETAVFNNQNGSIVEEEIEVVDLDTILKEISDLLIRDTKDTALVKNVDNKTYVFVKTFDLEHSKKHNISKNIDLKLKPVQLTNKSIDIHFDWNKTIETSDKNLEEILKKSIEQDNEIFNDDFEKLYIGFNDDNSTDYLDIDYIEIYKNATVEEYIYIPTEPTSSVNELSIDFDEQNKKVEAYSLDMVGEHENKTEFKDQDLKDDNDSFIPWITTIFLVNKTNNFQFDYLCDGILVSENTILTGARCVHQKNTTIDPKDLLIVLGKKSLQTTAESEKITKIKHVIIHDNFTNDSGKVENDLAILVMEEPVAENYGIKVANISDFEEYDMESDEAATTAWSLSGEITPIYFEKNDDNNICTYINKVENTICTTYGNEVAFCPSYGGVYAAKIEDEWYLQGVFYGDPADRGICFNKSVLYTSLKNYLIWITDTITSY